MLENVAYLISRLLGSTAEVVIHDMKSGEIVWIANGELTGRKTGKTNERLAIRFVAEQSRQVDEHNCIIGYLSNNKGTRPLRSSNLFVRDNTGELRYALCVNQDISQFQAMQSFLDNFVGTDVKEAPAGLGNQTMEELATSIMLEEMARVTPYIKESREEKLDILRRLDDKHVFEVRKVVPKVAEMLHISQATLYNYLRELRKEET